MVQLHRKTVIRHPIRIGLPLIATSLTLIFITRMDVVTAHGRLLDPPSRASAWRFGFGTPKDYTDDEGFCGGFRRQWDVNKGKCGICGDPHDEVIKPHEAPGGRFATGTITKSYIAGQTITVNLELTAAHNGFFNFNLCPNDNIKEDPKQECFEKYPLLLANTKDGYYYDIGDLPEGNYLVRVQLPKDVTCSQCIFQWTYTAGNRWGTCPDGTGAMGCGPQETFRACSDVTITSVVPETRKGLYHVDRFGSFGHRFGVVDNDEGFHNDDEQDYYEYADDKYADERYFDDRYVDDGYVDDEYDEDEYEEDKYGEDEYGDDSGDYNRDTPKIWLWWG